MDHGFHHQIRVNKWHEVIGGQTIGYAIRDRIIHDVASVELRGESIRKKRLYYLKNQPKTKLKTWAIATDTRYLSDRNYQLTHGGHFVAK